MGAASILPQSAGKSFDRGDRGAKQQSTELAGQPGNRPDIQSSDGIATLGHRRGMGRLSKPPYSLYLPLLTRRAARVARELHFGCWLSGQRNPQTGENRRAEPRFFQ